MDILSATYVTTMSDGQKWAVPVERIAFNHAHYYAKRDGISFDETLKRGTIPLFENDHFEIEDWAQNNMDWSDVVKYARIIDDPACDFQEGWVNGEHSIEIKE